MKAKQKKTNNAKKRKRANKTAMRIYIDDIPTAPDQPLDSCSDKMDKGMTSKMRMAGSSNRCEPSYTTQCKRGYRKKHKSLCSKKLNAGDIGMNTPVSDDTGCITKTCKMCKTRNSNKRQQNVPRCPKRRRLQCPKRGGPRGPKQRRVCCPKRRKACRPKRRKPCRRKPYCPKRCKNRSRKTRSDYRIYAKFLMLWKKLYPNLNQDNLNKRVSKAWKYLTNFERQLLKETSLSDLAIESIMSKVPEN